MGSKQLGSYDVASYRPMTFFDQIAGFRDGSNDPRRYLENCLDVIASREPDVKAWVVMNVEAARAAADQSAARWRDGKPMSTIDGLPIGIKDLIETKDMPTQMGCDAYAGNFPKRDSAVVRALREAGAIVLGKLVTSELGGSNPGQTRNPFDAARTPGGSSSGSAAAVGARMIPASIGTQVGGSVIRPASFCANWALKPTYGAMNRGERQGYSQSHIGVHAGTPEDMWQVAIEVAKRSGGDPGHPGLFGPLQVPEPIKPQTLLLLETEGFPIIDAAAKHALETVIESLRSKGVAIITRRDSPLLDELEQSLASASVLNRDIVAYEARWSTENIIEQFPGKLSKRGLATLERGRSVTLEQYRRCLLQREDARRRLAAVAPLGDAIISLAAPGPAPIHDESSSRPTGNAVFNFPSSLLGAPTVNVPLMSVAGLPLGLQVLGQPHGDAHVTGIARWIHTNVSFDAR